MRILIIGSGLIGVTTAYMLRRRGHEVTVLDRAEGPGLDTSFANAGLLTPSLADPWNAPGSWRVLLRSLGRSDAALQLRFRALPSIAGWGIGFLRNSRRATFERNTLTNTRLALYSLQVMSALRQQTQIDYGRAAPGILKVFRDRTTFEQASEAADHLASEGLSCRSVCPTEIVELEPALAPIAKQLTGAMYYANDETGDAYRFCVALADRARRQGVELRFGTEVSSLELHAGEVSAAVSGRQRFVADRYVVSAGSYSTPLLRRAGIRLPVRPAKGYSITFATEEHRSSLRIPVVDHHWHAAVIPLNGALRVAGTAEFAGYDRTIDPARIRHLKSLLQHVLPAAPVDPTAGRAWTGLRAMSMDGVPIIGPTPIPNLFVNTGHGHLGWTMTAASAQLLADLVCGAAPALDPAPFALARFLK